MATQDKISTCSMLKKLTEEILGAKTFLPIPKWEVEGGSIPRTFFTDRLKRNADKPINDEAVLWLVRLYSAQLGLFKMREPIGETRRVQIANDLAKYLSEITGIGLVKLYTSINDLEFTEKSKCLIDILSSVLNSVVDREYFDSDVASIHSSYLIKNSVQDSDFDNSLKVACVSEVNRKCPFCNHMLVNSTGGKTIEQYKIIKFPVLGTSGEAEYLAVCNNCYEKYKDVSDEENICRLNEKKNSIFAKSNYEQAVDALEMEKEVGQVLDALVATDPEEMPKFQYTPVEVREKIPDDKMLCAKILSNVVQYFPFVEEKLKQLNNERRLTYEKISGDVKRAYLEFATNETDKEVIFNKLCDWLAEKAHTDKKSACEVIISYYVQNCEVFEREIT